MFRHRAADRGTPPALTASYYDAVMPQTARNGRVYWDMTPRRAKIIAAVLRRCTNAVSEWTGLERAADEIDQP